MKDASIDLEAAQESVKRYNNATELVYGAIRERYRDFEGRAFIVETSAGRKVVTVTLIYADDDAGCRERVEIKVLDVG